MSQGQTRVISGDSPEASAWKLPSVDGGGRGGPEERQPERAAPSVEEIERLQKAAWDEAYAEGRKAGHEAGYGEGLKAGRERGEAEARQLVQRLQGLLDSLVQPAEELDEGTEQELAELAVMLARQIIRRELQTQPGEVIGIIREAVALLPLSTRRIRIRLHPEDAAFVRETLGDTEGRWELVEDPAIERGGCLLDTEVSRVDATLEHRIAALAASVLGDDRRPGAGEDDA